MRKLIMTFFLATLVLIPILATAESDIDIENIDLDEIDASELDIGDLDISELTANITLRAFLEVIVSKTESIEINSSALNFILPRAVKIVPSDTNEPFILLLSKEGISILDEAEYQKTPDFEAGLLILLSDKAIRVDYIKPNSFVACVLANILGKQYDVRIENTDTTKYKIANFMIDTACKLSGKCVTGEKIPFEVKLGD